MQTGFSPLFTHLKNLFLDDDGQDLIEYALLVSMVSLAIVAAMQSVAVDISNSFTTVATTFSRDLRGGHGGGD